MQIFATGANCEFSQLRQNANFRDSDKMRIVATATKCELSRRRQNAYCRDNNTATNVAHRCKKIVARSVGERIFIFVDQLNGRRFFPCMFTVYLLVITRRYTVNLQGKIKLPWVIQQPRPLYKSIKITVNNYLRQRSTLKIKQLCLLEIPLPSKGNSSE